MQTEDISAAQNCTCLETREEDQKKVMESQKREVLVNSHREWMYRRWTDPFSVLIALKLEIVEVPVVPPEK